MTSPVVVLGYAGSGAAQVQQLLAGCAELGCTSGTGLLPLCAQATLAWQQVDDRDGPLSALALSSTRAMVSTMITALLARTGGSRWCELAFATTASAEAFLQVVPASRFLCLHRSCAAVIQVAVQANPWGLEATPFARFAASYPASSAATIAAYWVSVTGPLLAFEQAHEDSCLRVRYEDLDGESGEAVRQLLAFLNLAGVDMSLWPPRPEGPAADDALAGTGAADQLPPALRAQVDELQRRLGYPPLA